MNPEHVPERLRDLIDDYLSGSLDEAGMRELEDLLRAEAAARHFFVRYARVDTDLRLEVRAYRAGAGALDRIDQLVRGTTAPRWRWRAVAAALAASVLITVTVGWWLLSGRPAQDGGADREPAVAWLVNAQNCTWSDDVGPAGDLRAGTVLRMERGLAEVRFACGASVVLEGPAGLELLSGQSARLLRGKLTARVPEAGAGFTVLSPQGKVIDLGTQFGVSVADNGATDVYVFEGKVEAHPAGSGQTGLSLTRNQAARIAAGKVTLRPADAGGEFVRAIVPPPVIAPRTLRLTFDREAARTLGDAAGRGTGLTHRLPGTGGRLPEHDPNLRLDPERGRLELTTTRSDINNQFRLGQGEYLGVRLSDLGFTGREDFTVTAVIPDSPALEAAGQFGLYAGTRGDRNIRGGLIKWGKPGENTQFLVNNNGGRDTDLYKVGLLSPGTDIRLTLKRTGGKYALTSANLTDGATSTLTIRHPDFLDGEPDLFVGLFGANPFNDARKTLVIKEFSVTVWTVTPAAPR